MSIDSHTSSESGKSGLSSFTSTSTTSSSFSSCGAYELPPPTTNLLSSRQKAQLRRSTTKLAKILGEAPICVDVDGYAYDEGFGGMRKYDSSCRQKKLQPSLSITSSWNRSHEGAANVSVRRARSAAATGRTVIDPDLYPLSATLRPTSCDAVRHRACASPVSGATVRRSSESRRARTKSGRQFRSLSSEFTLLLDGNDDNNVKYVYEDGKTATSFLIISPIPNPRAHHTQIQTQTQMLENVTRTRKGGARTRSQRDSMCDSLYEPTFAIPSTTALRREKMARVQKLLGEDVPIELVFPGSVSSRCDEKYNVTGGDVPIPSFEARGDTSPQRARVNSDSDSDSDSRSELNSAVLDIHVDADGKPQEHVNPFAPPTESESDLDAGVESRSDAAANTNANAVVDVHTDTHADDHADIDVDAKVEVDVEVPPPTPPKFEIKRKPVPSLPPVLLSSQEPRSENAENGDGDGPRVPPNSSPALQEQEQEQEQEQGQRVSALQNQNQIRRPAYRPSRPNIRLETIIEQSPRASILSSTSSTSTTSSSPKSESDGFRDSVDSTSSLLTNTTSSSYRFTSSADSHTHAHIHATKGKGESDTGLETTEEVCPGARARARIRELREQHGRREFGVYIPFSRRQSNNSTSSGILKARSCQTGVASEESEIVRGMVGLRV